MCGGYEAAHTGMTGRLGLYARKVVDDEILLS